MDWTLSGPEELLSAQRARPDVPAHRLQQGPSLTQTLSPLHRQLLHHHHLLPLPLSLLHLHRSISLYKQNSLHQGFMHTSSSIPIPEPSREEKA